MELVKLTIDNKEIEVPKGKYKFYAESGEYLPLTNLEYLPRIIELAALTVLGSYIINNIDKFSF